MNVPGCPLPRSSAASQWRALTDLLRELREANPFYQAKLAGVDLERNAPSLADFLNRLPFTTRAELLADQCQHPPYGRNQTYPLTRYPYLSRAAAAGHDLYWLDTPESWQQQIAGWRRAFEAAGIYPVDHVLGAAPCGPERLSWAACAAMQQMGALTIAGGTMTPDEAIRAIVEHSVSVLCAAPATAVAIAEAAGRLGIEPRQTGLRRILLTHEGDSEIAARRARLRQLWPSASVAEQLCFLETGPLGFSCASLRNLICLLETHHLIEVLEPATLTPAKPGQMGELVVTTLQRPGMPVLRFRTGFLVRHRASPCGYFSLEDGILGQLGTEA